MTEWRKMHETCTFHVMRFWTAVKKYFGHDPDYKPWMIYRDESYPYVWVHGPDGNGGTVQGFVVPRDEWAQRAAGGQFPTVPFNVALNTERFWM